MMLFLAVWSKQPEILLPNCKSNLTQDNNLLINENKKGALIKTPL
jgi:hypothetical protein